MTEEHFLKRCPKCAETKPCDLFSRDRTKKDGRCSHCKACIDSKDMREYMRNYDRVNADKIRLRKQRYYIENGEEMRQKHRAYYAANAQTIIEHQRLYNMNNRQWIRERSRLYEIAHRDLRRAANQRRRARKKGNGGTFTRHELSAMRSKQAGICAYCQRQYDPDALTIDHVIPIDQGGRHEAANIVLACGICNASKRNRTPEQWVNRWYLRPDAPQPRTDRRKKPLNKG